MGSRIRYMFQAELVSRRARPIWMPRIRLVAPFAPCTANGVGADNCSSREMTSLLSYGSAWWKRRPFRQPHFERGTISGSRQIREPDSGTGIGQTTGTVNRGESCEMNSEVAPQSSEVRFPSISKVTTRRSRRRWRARCFPSASIVSDLVEALVPGVEMVQPSQDQSEES
jgi:hypothetical protein